MICKTTRGQWMAQRDGELSPEATAQLRAHLEGCPECVKACAALEATLQAADAWAVDGSDVWASINQVIALESTESVFSEPLSAVMAELAVLRKEMRVLRTEVQMLRAELAAREPRSSTRSADARHPLLPYATNSESRLRLV